jgi:hypothetical protein
MKFAKQSKAVRGYVWAMGNENGKNINKQI